MFTASSDTATMNTSEEQLNAGFKKKVHGIETLRHQEFCLRHLVEFKRDVFACLPMRYGKSIIL